MNFLEHFWLCCEFAMLIYTIRLKWESKCSDTMPEQRFYPVTKMLRFAFSKPLSSAVSFQTL